MQPAKGGWAPFEATQEIATRPPGFVRSRRGRIVDVAYEFAEPG